MLGQDRQEELLHYLRAHRYGHVAELSQVLGASPSTIRRDLDDLQVRGLVERIHGGATIPTSNEAAPVLRERDRPDEKRRIGQAAAEFVQPGTTILISGGTTTECMLPFLGDIADLTVITNGVNIASRMAEYTDVAVIMLGGELRRESMSLLGHLVINALSEFHVAQVFTGAFGIDAEIGITGANLHETQTDRAILRSAEHNYVLVDSSKFAQRGPVRLAPIHEVGHVITDQEVDETTLRALREKGVEVTLC